MAILKQSTITSIINNNTVLVKENTSDNVSEGIENFNNSTGGLRKKIGDALAGNAIFETKAAVANMLNSPLANDILRIGGDLNSISKTTALDISCNNIRDIISKNEDTIQLDNTLIDKLLVQRVIQVKDPTKEIFFILDQIRTTLKQLRKGANVTLEAYLMGIVNLVLGSLPTEGYSPEAIISLIINQLLEMLKPFLSLPAMPEIPLIGDIPTMLEQLVKLGEIARNMKKENESSEEKDESFWGTVEDTAGEMIKPFRDLLENIVDMVLQIIDMSPFILQILAISFIIEFLDTLKPVLDYFGLALGPYAKLILTVPSILPIISGTLAMGKDKLKEIFINGMLNDITSLFYNITDPGDLSIDDKLRYLLTEVETKTLENTKQENTLNVLLASSALSSENETLSTMKKEFNKKTDTKQENENENEKGNWFSRNIVGGLDSLLGYSEDTEETPGEKKLKEQEIEQLNSNIETQEKAVKRAEKRLNTLSTELVNFNANYDSKLNEIPVKVEKYINSGEMYERQQMLYKNDQAAKKAGVSQAIINFMGVGINGK